MILFVQGIKQEKEKQTAKWYGEFEIQNQKPVKLSKKEKKTLKEAKKMKSKKMDVDKVSDSVNWALYRLGLSY